MRVRDYLLELRRRAISQSPWIREVECIAGYVEVITYGDAVTRSILRCVDVKDGRLDVKTFDVQLTPKNIETIMEIVSSGTYPVLRLRVLATQVIDIEKVSDDGLSRIVDKLLQHDLAICGARTEDGNEVTVEVEGMVVRFSRKYPSNAKTHLSKLFDAGARDLCIVVLPSGYDRATTRAIYVAHVMVFSMDEVAGSGAGASPSAAGAEDVGGESKNVEMIEGGGTGDAGEVRGEDLGISDDELRALEEELGGGENG